MSPRTNDDEWERVETVRPNAPGGGQTIEAYEDNGNVVLYDAENPLAWVETTRAVQLRDCA